MLSRVFEKKQLADSFSMIFAGVEILKLIQGRVFTWQIKICGQHLKKQGALWIT